jgi:NAD(P)-dependent dehydrogenase (short-subunit alcohol dehydrogenase family)
MPTPYDNSSPVVLVTGASKGIGLGIAEFFYAKGYQVIGCGTSECQSGVFKDPIRTFYFRCDVTQKDAGSRLSAAVQARSERLDVLVNNAGGAIEFGSFLDIDDAVWVQSYELNVVSAVRMTKAVLPLLEKSGCGRIVNICSTTAVMPGMFNPHYSAAKAALLNFTKHLSNILAKKNILVNALNVGPVKTESWKKNVENYARLKGVSEPVADMEMTEQEKQKIPLNSLGTVGDVARAVFFLASAENKWMTGSCLNLDGGKNRGV